jgi:hypothetical protein
MDRKLITIRVSKINLVPAFQKIQHYFTSTCVACLTIEYFKRFRTFNLYSASRSRQSHCYSKRMRLLWLNLKIAFVMEKNVKATKYFSTVGWILEFFISFHSAVGLLPFITFPIFTWIILFPSLFLLPHSVVFLMSPWNSKSIKLGA